MSSQCTNDGSYSLSVTFKPGIDLSFAQVLVQNRVNLALPQLPDVVKQAGVTTRKRSPEILLIVSINSPHGGIDQLYLSNFATIQLKDELCRVEGVGDVIMFGQQDYSMRIWVDPDKLYTRGMTTDDVVNAVAEQNQHIAAGQLGQPPVPRGQVFQYPDHHQGPIVGPERLRRNGRQDDARRDGGARAGHRPLHTRRQEPRHNFPHRRSSHAPISPSSSFPMPTRSIRPSASRKRWRS